MLTRNIPRTSPLHNFLKKRLENRIKFGKRTQSQMTKRWEQAEDAANAYLPESEIDAMRRADRENRGNPRYTTIQLPYSYALLMTFHTYVTSIFFGRSPVHQFSGRHGESEDQVQAMEALIGYQTEVGRLLAPYYIWMYDVGKYGAGILGTYWCQEDVQYSTLQAVQSLPGESGGKNIQVTIREPGYYGNKVYNVAPFDFIHDGHFPIGRFQEGEFVAVRKVMSWSEVVRRKAQGYYMNCEVLAQNKSGTPDKSNQGNSSLLRPEPAGMFQDEASDDKHPTSVEVWEVYVDLIQNDWQLGDSQFPEKWVFTITSDYSTIIGAQPLGAAHGKFPFDIAESEVEGYGLYNRGIPEIIRPIQNTMDWLINTHFYNVRASLNNQFIIDPSKIIVTDAEDGGPGFIYRLRPEAYGSDVRSFFYQIPVQDVTQQHVGDLQQMLAIGEKVMGINDQMFGSLSGGRKTATEVRTSTGFGVNRLKTIAEYISCASFSTHAQMLVQHTQQFYDQEKKFKIIGDIKNLLTPEEQFKLVTPDSIAGFFDFVPVDGTLPVDRMAMTTLWLAIMNQLRAYPPLMQQYDISKIFAYTATLSGARNVQSFRIQVVPDGLLQNQVQQGNVVPMRPGGSPGMSPQGGGAPPPPPPLPPVGPPGEALG